MTAHRTQFPSGQPLRSINSVCPHTPMCELTIHWSFHIFDPEMKLDDRVDYDDTVDTIRRFSITILIISIQLHSTRTTLASRPMWCVCFDLITVCARLGKSVSILTPSRALMANEMKFIRIEFVLAVVSTEQLPVVWQLMARCFSRFFGILYARHRAMV